MTGVVQFLPAGLGGLLRGGVQVSGLGAVRATFAFAVLRAVAYGRGHRSIRAAVSTDWAGRGYCRPRLVDDSIA